MQDTSKETVMSDFSDKASAAESLYFSSESYRPSVLLPDIKIRHETQHYETVTHDSSHISLKCVRRLLFCPHEYKQQPASNDIMDFPDTVPPTFQLCADSNPNNF